MPTGDPIISTAKYELQEDIYSILSGDSTIVTTRGATVKAHFDDGDSFPRVSVGSGTMVPQYHKSGALQELAWTISIWDELRDRKRLTNWRTMWSRH